MKYTWLFLALTACAPTPAPESSQYSTGTKPLSPLTAEDVDFVIAQEIRAQYPATTTYSADGLSARGKVRPASLYSRGYADGCTAGVGGPQLKNTSWAFDKEYSRGWKAGKRTCKANYDLLLRELT